MEPNKTRGQKADTCLAMIDLYLGLMFDEEFAEKMENINFQKWGEFLCEMMSKSKKKKVQKKKRYMNFMSFGKVQSIRM